jgi:hypothetical protein
LPSKHSMQSLARSGAKSQPRAALCASSSRIRQQHSLSFVKPTPVNRFVRRSIVRRAASSSSFDNQTSIIKPAPLPAASGLSAFWGAMQGVMHAMTFLASMLAYIGSVAVAPQVQWGPHSVLPYDLIQADNEQQEQLARSRSQVSWSMHMADRQHCIRPECLELNLESSGFSPPTSS